MFFLHATNALFSKSQKTVNIFGGYREFIIGPSARSGYLCTALDRKTTRKRGEVCREGAVQNYPDLRRGDSKKSIFFLVEVGSVMSQLSLFLSFSPLFLHGMHHLYLLLCNQTGRMVAASTVTLKMKDTKLQNHKISAVMDKARDDSAPATYR